MDLKQAQSLLMNQKIPKKRNLQQRDLDDFDDEEIDVNGQQALEALEGTRKRAILDQDDPDLEMQRRQLQMSIAEQTKNLPITKHKNLIMRKLEKNRVLVISGDTGCGKTTQVPKYILEQAEFKKQECKIICTQPRRIAAVNISKRVSQELGERVGQRVGYHVGMQSRRTKGVTKITFMTTGIFLQRLVNNPESLKKCTHIIMDEVHERDLDIDFSLVVIKHLLLKEQEGFNFKLILMSATFNIELFSNYFSKTAIKEIESLQVYVGVEEMLKKAEEEKRLKLEMQWGPCKNEDWNNAKVPQNQQEDEEDEWVECDDITKKNAMPVEKRNDPAEIIEINARLFEVREFYIEMIVKNMLNDTVIEKTAQDKELLLEALSVCEGNKPQVKESVMRVAAMLICDIIEKHNRFNDAEGDKRSILVFLPGLYEIFEFMDFIMETYEHQWVRNNLELIPLHSSLCEEEQERAFKNSQRLDGKRKVIIATNIAESSITIPDIKYVIDFMLTKELFYDPMTKSESLVLSWVSKASSKQRAGRAGRVADGFVFRMCTEKFYNHSIPEYPKPEMQRCPLEKLILQVKLWNRYEPEEVLGRAIQPPEYRDICNAIKNLQQTGALTIPPPYAKTEEEKRSKITALGKIFVNLPCDLKITRLFLFGMALKCMQQAIIMGCIHQQSRSIFRNNRVIDWVNMTKLQCLYDDNRDSDSIMLLKVFQEWIHKFHPQLKHKQNQPGQPVQQQQRSEFQHRRLRFSRVNFQERQWCKDRNLDLTILKEVATMVEEIRYRFQKMNIPERCLNSKVKLREDNPDAVLILKTCIGGAFYNKYVKAAFKNEDILSKMQASNVFLTDEAKRSLILNKVSDHITEKHLKQFFETKFKVPVESVKISVDKPTIIFHQDILERGFIKACFKLGMRNRVSRYRKLQDDEYDDQAKFKSKIIYDDRPISKDAVFSYDEVRDQLENEELRRPCYLYELRFETINKDAYVEFDRDSINNFTYELEEKMLPHITYACQDFYDKGGRFLCRNGTRLPRIHMVDALFSLIFAPVVQVKADSKKLYFQKIICDEGDTIIKLTHILTHQDLEIIQKIRTMMNESLCSEDNQKQAHLAQVDFYIKRLFSFNRLSVDVFEKLMMLREEDKVDNSKKSKIKVQKEDNTEKNELDQFMQGEMNFFLQDQMDLKVKEGEGYDEVDAINEDDENQQMVSVQEMEQRQKRYERECSMGYFLQPIYVQKLKKKIYFYDELVKEMENEFKRRVSEKRDIIKRMKQKQKEYALMEALMICERCLQDIAPMRTFEFINNELHYAKCVFGSLRRVELREIEDPIYAEDQEFIQLYIDEYENLKKQIKQYENPPRNQQQQQPPPPKDYAFAKCRSNHILGIVVDKKFYITDVSQVKLMFPNCQYESWDSRWWQKGYKTVISHQQKTQLNRAQACFKEGWNTDNSDVLILECELCEVFCKGPEEFCAHCSSNEKHKELEQKFSSTQFDYLFENDDLLKNIKTIEKSEKMTI